MAIMIVYRMQHSAHVTRCEVEGMMRQLSKKKQGVDGPVSRLTPAVAFASCTQERNVLIVHGADDGQGGSIVAVARKLNAAVLGAAPRNGRDGTRHNTTPVPCHTRAQRVISITNLKSVGVYIRQGLQIQNRLM